MASVTQARPFVSYTAGRRTRVNMDAVVKGAQLVKADMRGGQSPVASAQRQVPARGK